MGKNGLAVALICIAAVFMSVMAFTQNGKVEEKDYKKAKEYFRNEAVSKKPCTKEDGTRYTVAYVDIDPYPASGEMLYYFVEELKKTGWIDYDEKLPFLPEETDAKELIYYLANKDLGQYIQFSEDACYYIAEDDKEKCKKSLQKQIDKGKVDLIFCMGTSPGEMVIKEMKVKDVPVMVYFSVDPVGAGLSKEEEYSGRDNVWCHTSFEVYTNQIQFYHRNCPFQNIGMVYYNKSVAAMDAYRKAAKEIGFKITKRKIDTISDAKDKEQVAAYYEELKEVFSELVHVEKIDAFLLNTDVIKDEKRIGKLLEVFYKNKIPVFVQNGEYYVKDGAFMVVTASDAKVQAPFAVEAMASILNGMRPGEVYQKFVPSPYLSINLKVADRLGYEVEEELLLSAEKLYQKVKK